MTAPDDFERRLRGALRGRHLDIEPAADALARVHAAARRRQTRRLTAAGSASVAAVAAVAVVVSGAVAGSGHGPGHGPGVTADSRPRLLATSSTLGASEAPASAASPAMTTSESAAVVAPSAASATEPGFASLARGFAPVSVSAISTESYWVLGYEPAASGPESNKTALMATTDGGKTFVRVGNPNVLLSQVPRANTPDARMVSDVRFADETHGWLYGDALWETDDGGVSWNQQAVSGNVIDLATFDGSAWAVSRLSAGSSPTYGVFHATYSGDAATKGWSQLKLPFTPGAQQPSLAVQKDVAYVLVADNVEPRAGSAPTGHDHLVSITADGTVVDHPAPCSSDMPSRLSAGGAAGVLWATCQTGTQAGVYVSDDAGATWTPVPRDFWNGVEIGAISATEAVVADNTGAPLAVLRADGTTWPAVVPDSATDATFIGFTTTSVGFALTAHDGVRQLWRTTDGGATWDAVDFAITTP